MPLPPAAPGPRSLLATAFVLLAAACGGDGVAVAFEPLRLASADPYCAPVVEQVLARYEEGVAARALPDDPRYGGTVVVAGGADLAGGLNGLTTRDQTTQEIELHLLHVTLIRKGANLESLPYLAESWTLEEDGTGITFRLRPDLAWHDGVPVTARDVAFTASGAMDPAAGFPNSGWFALYDADGIEVVDDQTVRFRFQPHAEEMDPWASLPIMPAHLLADVPTGEWLEHPFGTACPVGAGPFLFESYAPGDQWVLRANPWFPEDLGGRPFVDRWVYRVVTSSATRAGELAAGGVDVALGLEPVDAEMLADRPGVRLEEIDQRSFSFIGWNTRRPGLDDPRVRTALTMALDRQSLVRTLRGGHGVVAQTGVPAFHWAHDPSLEGPDYDPDGARALLDAAGWRDTDGDGVRDDGAGRALRFEVLTNVSPEREGIGDVVRDQLGEVGVSVDFQTLEMGSLSARVLTPGDRDFDGFIMGWTHDFNINERDFFHSYADEGHPYGWSALGDSVLDRLLDTLPAIRDREVARPLWRAYQERVIELQPFTWLYFSQRLDGVDAALRGVEMDLRGELVSAPGWHWDPDAR